MTARPTLSQCDELQTHLASPLAGLLEQLSDNMLRLEEVAAETSAAARQEAAAPIAATAQRLATLSAFLGLPGVNRLAHQVHVALHAAQRGAASLDGPQIELLIQAAAQLIECARHCDRGPIDDASCQKTAARLGALLGSDPHAASGPVAEQSAGAARGRNATPSAAAPSPGAESLRRESPDAAPLDDSGKLFEHVTDEPHVPARYLAIFIDETELSLDGLIETLLREDAADDPAAVQALLITAHRIKGSAASVGLHRAAKLAHVMEDALQELRESAGRLSSELVDALLACADALRQYVHGLKTGRAETGEFPRAAAGLLSCQGATRKPSAGEPPHAVRPAVPEAPQRGFPPELTELAAEHATAATPVLLGRVHFAPRLPLAGLKGQLVCEKLLHLGDLIYCQPPAEGIDLRDELTAITFALATEMTVEEVRSRLFVSGVADIELATRTADPAAGRAAEVRSSSAPPANDTPLQPVRVEADSSAPSGGGRSAAMRLEDGRRPNETLRVDIERLDQLMNLAGQLVLNKSRFSQIGEGLKQLALGRDAARFLGEIEGLVGRMLAAPETPAGGIGGEDWRLIRCHAQRLLEEARQAEAEVRRLAELRPLVGRLFEAVHELDRVADGIQKSVMDTRMVPIGPLFTRFKRVVRDISRLNGKEIRLEVRGEKTELDKRMIDELGDPLIQMVRNAADHGIEPPEVRLAAGKPRCGTITLDAFHQGNNILIQVRDDGRGLDRPRIVAKALERGLISEADAARFTDHEIDQLIWAPGLSTAQRVTEVSGRGMGMDIVRAKIEAVHGSGEVVSRPGEGTTFTIKLPLTLAILPSLLARIEGGVFAIPVGSVIEIVQVPPADVAPVQGRLTARIRGRVVSVMHLDEVFRDRRPAASRRDPQAEGCTLVVIGEDRREMGLVVDSLIGEQDIVTKSMSENYRNVPGIAGASILGDGRVALILDAAAVLDMACQLPAANATEEPGQ